MRDVTWNGCYISIDIIKMEIVFNNLPLTFNMILIPFVRRTFFMNKVVWEKKMSEETQTWKKCQENSSVNYFKFRLKLSFEVSRRFMIFDCFLMIIYAYSG